MGLAALPSISRIRPSRVYTSCEQPTAQYGHTLTCTSAPRIRGRVARVRALTGFGTAPTCVRSQRPRPMHSPVGEVAHGAPSLLPAHDHLMGRVMTVVY